MFNEYQKDYMRELSEMKPESKCWCGWYPKGQCEAGCPPDKTSADKISAWCKECHSAPSDYGKGEITHRIGCPTIAAQ